jgi:predicted dehydrogenase
MPHALHRRDLLKSSAALLAGGVWAGSFGRAADSDSPNEKLNLAVIGLGGQGVANLRESASHNVVALCDVDDVRAGKAYENHPQAQKFYDFREMFDKLEKQIDGVVVSTPDHTHFHPAYWALERKKHLYLEKPLCHSVWETRKITEMAREKKVATQLGAQRHAMPSLRAGVEIVKSGVLGDIKEVYAWIDSKRGMPERRPNEPPPDTLKWDLWLGPAEERPYRAGLAPYEWRFWWDFGTGDVGNWGCHILDIPFWALDLKHPHKVELTAGSEPDPERTPKAMFCKFTFPGNEKRGPIQLHWGQGRPSILEEKGLQGKGMRVLFVGSEGMLLTGFDTWKLYPEDKFHGFKAPKTFTPSPGFHHEWFNACKGGELATCHFDYSGPLAEVALLGNVAFRAKGGFDWDAPNLKPTGNPAAEQFLKSYFRKGWEV